MRNGRNMSRVMVRNCCLLLLLDEELGDEVSLSWSLTVCEGGLTVCEGGLTVCEGGLKVKCGGRSKQSFNGNAGKDRFRSMMLLS